MFIVNQERDLILNLEEIGFMTVDRDRIIVNNRDFATYASDKRAREVFKDMIENLSPTLVFQNIGLPEDVDVAELMKTNNHLVVSEDVRIEQVNPIYKLPKE